MSIEQALAENTAAIRELIDAIRNGIPTTAAQVAAVAAEAKAETPKVEKKAEAPKPDAEAESAATPEQKAEAADAEPVTYEAVAAAITKLSRAKGRDAAVALLARFDARKLPEVDESRFGEVLAAAEEELA